MTAALLAGTALVVGAAPAAASGPPQREVRNTCTTIAIPPDRTDLVSADGVLVVCENRTSTFHVTETPSGIVSVVVKDVARITESVDGEVVASASFLSTRRVLTKEGEELVLRFTAKGSDTFFGQDCTSSSKFVLVRGQVKVEDARLNCA